MFSRHTLNGTVKNISEDGLMAEFTGAPHQIDEDGSIYMDHCVLEVRRLWSSGRGDKVLAGFRIQFIKEGEKHWQEMLIQPECSHRSFIEIA